MALAVLTPVSALLAPLTISELRVSLAAPRSRTPELRDGQRRAALRRALRLPPREPPPSTSSLPPSPSPLTPSPQLELETSSGSSPTFAQSADERATLARLSALLADELPASGAADSFQEVHGEARLLRFLRKAKGDADEAAARYREMLEWRRDNGVDVVRGRLVAEQMAPAAMPHFELMQQLMPVTIWHDEADSGAVPGVPNGEGHGVQTFHIGRWDARGMVEARRTGALSEAEFLRHWTYANEYVSLQLERLSRERGSVAELQLVCDFSGANLRQISRSFFRMTAPWAKMSQDNYPSTSADIVFLNAPAFFTGIWGLVSPMIGEQTRSKIRFASSASSTEERAASPGY